MGSLNQQVCFNELSFQDKEDNEDTLLLFYNYVNTIKALKEKGFNGVRYEYGISSLIKDGLRNVYDLKNTNIGRIYFELIISTARSPYIESDTPEEDKYINESYEINVDDVWCAGQGFITAHIIKTIVISLSTHLRWSKNVFAIRDAKDKILKGEVINVDTPESSNTDAVNSFIEQRQPINLTKCSIAPERKHHKFRDDHGKDKLNLLWHKLRSCKYIESAINSLEFNPYGKEYIEKCFDDGKIHLRLVGSDKGYGMVIQEVCEKQKKLERI